jgi:hypothetical protein
MLGEAIDEGAETGGVVEDGAPLLEGEVGREDDRLGLMAPADDVEEKIGGAAVAGDVAELVELCGAPHKSTHVECLLMCSAPAVRRDLSSFVEPDST